MPMVMTTKGEMDESLLEKRTGADESDHERAEWVEYWHEGELVHRSVHLVLKKYSLTGAAVAASFG